MHQKNSSARAVAFSTTSTGCKLQVQPTNMAEVIEGESCHFLASCYLAKIYCGSLWHRSPSMSGPMVWLSNWLQPGADTFQQCYERTFTLSFFILSYLILSFFAYVDTFIMYLI